MKRILVTPSVSIRNTCDNADQLHRAVSGIGNTVIIVNEFWSFCPIKNGKCDLSFFSSVDMDSLFVVFNEALFSREAKTTELSYQI